MPESSSPQTVRLQIVDIVCDDLGIRIREPDERTVVYYSAIVDTLPPVTVYEVDGRYLLVDGYHRVEAAVRAGRSELDVTLHAGKTYGEAVWDAGFLNAAHPLRFTGADRLVAIRHCLAQFPERANHWIATALGVPDDSTVERARVELESAGKIARLDKLLGQDGKRRLRTMGALDDRVTDALVSHSSRSNAEISRETGANEHAVARVRMQLEDACSDEPPGRDPDYPDPRGEHKIRAQRLAWLEANSPEYDEAALQGTLIRGDCIEVMAGLEPASVDLILTDPPYGVDKGPWDFTKDDEDEFYAFTYRWAEAALRLLKPSGRIFVFWTSYWWHLLRIAVDEINKANHYGLVFSGAVIWQHNDTIRRQYTEKDCKLNYDPVLYWRGPEVPDLRFPGPWGGDFHRAAVWPAVQNFGTTHIAEKPLAIIDGILQIATDPNMLVLDPFLGSGTTAVACERLRRRWIGIDLFVGDSFDDGDTQMRYTQQRVMLEGHLGKDWREGIRA